jgi:hypothetical protein
MNAVAEPNRDIGQQSRCVHGKWLREREVAATNAKGLVEAWSAVGFAFDP